MANAVIQTRISSPLKKQAEALFAAMGLTVSDAVRLFLQQSINEGGLPFQPRLSRPNVETIAAMRELDGGGGESFENTDALFASWQKRK
jgi:DNA-damage-inducible protein J